MKATAVFDGRGIRITAESTCCGSAFTIRMKRAAISEYFAAASAETTTQKWCAYAWARVIGGFETSRENEACAR